MASKNAERLYLEHFLKEYPCFTIEDASKSREAPDFILRDSEGLIGFEVTQIFRDTSPAGSPSRAAEARRMKFLRKIADLYYPSGLPILVKAAIPDRPDEDPSTVADALRATRPAVLWQTETVSFPGDSKYLVTALPAELGSYKRWQCLNNHIGWVGRLERKTIVDCIQEKSKKLTEYKRAAERIALLLVVDRTVKSGMINPPGPESTFNSEGFSAVYLQIYPNKAARLV